MIGTEGTQPRLQGSDEVLQSPWVAGSAGRGRFDNTISVANAKGLDRKLQLWDRSTDETNTVPCQSARLDPACRNQCPCYVGRAKEGSRSGSGTCAGSGSAPRPRARLQSLATTQRWWIPNLGRQTTNTPAPCVRSAPSLIPVHPQIAADNNHAASARVQREERRRHPAGTPTRPCADNACLRWNLKSEVQLQHPRSEGWVGYGTKTRHR